MHGSLLFLSPMCLLDKSSGAAISVLNFLIALSKAGYHCTSFTASLLDPQWDVPVEHILGKTAAEEANRGKLAIYNEHGVTHNIFLTKSSRRIHMSPDEQIKFKSTWESWIVKNKPNAILTFGLCALSQELHKIARQNSIKLIFYLGNAEYNNATLLSNMDLIVCPSEFLKQHYKKTLGIEAKVVRTIMNHERLITSTSAAVASIPEAKELGFVTFMNPIAQKGLTLFILLIELAQRERPGMKFLVTEGRQSRKLLREWGVNIGAYPNVWWIPNQVDVRSIYLRTSILIVPSYWQEGFGRNVVEAQLSGIPVIASARGGIEEALNGGGFVLEVPDNCKKDHTKFPDEETVRCWFAAICKLWDDRDSYQSARERALRSAEAFHPDKISKDAVAFFSEQIKSAN